MVEPAGDLIEIHLSLLAALLEYALEVASVLLVFVGMKAAGLRLVVSGWFSRGCEGELLDLVLQHLPLPLVLPLLARLAGSLNTAPSRPALGDDELCRLDRPQEELYQRRRRALAP